MQHEPDPSGYQSLADSAEALFLKRQRTLTDPDTAEAYLVTVELFEHLLRGALATGVVDDAQHRELHDMVHGLKAVPDLL